MLQGFDHVTLIVEDIDAATARYAALLGADAAWRGDHPELGTRAVLFGLQNALIELVAPAPDAPEAEALRELVKTRGEGLQAIALATLDADRCSQTLRERGVRATPPQIGEARGADGSLRAFRTVELSSRATRGLSVFAVERPDPALFRLVGEPAPHRFGALDHVVIRTADPEAALALYGTGFGIRLALDREIAGVRMLFFRVGGVTLEVVHDPSCAQSDQLWGLAYRVRDIEAAHARLKDGGFTLSDVKPGKKPQTRVFSVRDGTCGVRTLVLRDPARE